MTEKSVVPATQPDLQKLRFRRKLDGPINWADLHCIEARSWQNNYGQTGVTVEIEEAAPGCENDAFCNYISKRLAKLGFQNIEVNTEW